MRIDNFLRIQKIDRDKAAYTIVAIGWLAAMAYLSKQIDILNHNPNYFDKFNQNMALFISSFGIVASWLIYKNSYYEDFVYKNIINSKLNQRNIYISVAGLGLIALTKTYLGIERSGIEPFLGSILITSIASYKALKKNMEINGKKLEFTLFKIDRSQMTNYFKNAIYVLMISAFLFSNGDFRPIQQASIELLTSAPLIGPYVRLYYNYLQKPLYNVVIDSEKFIADSINGVSDAARTVTSQMPVISKNQLNLDRSTFFPSGNCNNKHFITIEDNPNTLVAIGNKSINDILNNNGIASIDDLRIGMTICLD